MCQQEPDLSIEVTMSAVPKQGLPQHDRIHPRRIWQIPRYSRLRYLWQRLGAVLDPWLARCYWSTRREGILHATYYAFPSAVRLPKVVTVYDMIVERLSGFFDRDIVERLTNTKQRCVEEADTVICISEATKRDVVEIFNVAPDKLFVTHLAASDVFHVRDDAASLPAERFPNLRRPFVMYVGRRRAKYKNFERALEAYSRSSFTKDYDLVVVSDGAWNADEMQRMEDLGVRTRVHRLERLADTDLSLLYNVAAAFIYPSLYEGFGIPVLEALSCGCPVAASRTSSIPEIGGDVVSYFDPYDRESISEALWQAVREGRSPDLVKRRVTHASSFSWDETARRTLAVYRTLL